MIRHLAVSSRTVLLLVILLSTSFTLALGDSDRLLKLKALKSRSPNGFIRFDISTFESFVESTSRSYSILLMFSADPSMCQPCGAVRKQIQKICTEYERLPAKKKASKPLFFAELEISPSDQQFLAKYQLQHVPVIYYFRAGESRSYPRRIADDSPDNYPLQQSGLSPNQMKKFVNSRSGSKFTIVQGGYQIPFVQTVRAFMPLIVTMVASAIGVAIITGAYKSPMLWFAVVVVVYIFSVGGGHYSWINNVPLVSVNKDGIWEYIAGGSRSQYVAEGFFVSATCVAISVLVILIQELPSVLPNKAGQTIIGSSMVFMTVFAITALLGMYHIKMPQYLQYTEM